ncbi:unnamed protein product [Rotaria sordida]|uniref:F-box domain-containing protein n=1 Tax=Rotaria sordida TaxID=392033 RepID=A0A819UTZ5_9BILA|nr:unnamed protein product [Rotaria sordida]
MSDQPIASFYTLPLELIHYIFGYLDAKTIVRTFRSICKRFYIAVKTYDQVKLDFNSISKSDFLFLCNFIESKNIESLTLSDRDETPGQIEYFLSFIRIKYFNRLRSLTLLEIDDCYLNIILKDIQTLTLNLLSIHSKQDYSQSNTSTNAFSLALSLPNLYKLKWNISSFDLSKISWHFNNTIKHLDICCRTLDEYCNILYHLPNLQSLVVEQWHETVDDDTIDKWSNLKPFHQLLSLTFKYCSIDMIILDSLLLLTPTLEQLRLIRAVDVHVFLSHLQQWEKFVETKLPSLINFECFLTEDLLYFDNPHPIDTELLIAPFRKPFWTGTKSWFVICDHIVCPRTVILYTPGSFDPQFEYVYESKEILRSTSAPTITNTIVMNGVRKMRMDLTKVMTAATSPQV